MDFFTNILEFWPLLVIVFAITSIGGYGFYKHAVKHTDGSDDIQSATSSQKGVMSAAQAAKLQGLITDPLGGDGVAGRIPRGIMLSVTNGGAASTLKCSVVSRWNGDTIAVTDNVAKGATTGRFTLNSVGTALEIEAAGLSGNCVYAMCNLYSNASGVDLTYRVFATGNNIEIRVYASTTGVGQDLTTLVDTGAMYFHIFYITDA